MLPNINSKEIINFFSIGSHLERLLESDMKGNPTYIGITLKKITDILNENNIEFALAGALALGIRCTPRYTIDIDLIVHPDNYRALEKIFIEHEFQILISDEYMITIKDTTTGVEIDFLFSPFDPEESGRVTATKEKIFGVSLPVIQSEFLLWMYLLSTQEKHKVDGINLIKSGNVNIEKLIDYLNYDKDEESIARLNHWISIAYTEMSETYSKTVNRRKILRERKD